ncbi:hypothetical protein AQBE111736_03175 [Aquirufa beregesia]
MAKITITKVGSMLRPQRISIKNARSREYLSRNLEEHDTFHLPPGNHVIEIAFRFNMFLFPPSRFSIDVPEGQTSIF